MEEIRFAPLVRVSTETQAQKGESLRTQKKQILHYTNQLGGRVVTWEYSGQEHATPDQERVKLEKLLSDSGKGLFDAVIVCDLSRWSRDNRRSKEGVAILKANGIRFFVGPTEYDFNRPEHCLFMGMAGEINEFHARNQSLKSLQSRIERARRNVPTCGKLPYGRVWSEREGWGIDKKKQQKIQYAAERYLSGECMSKIAETLGMNHSNLWKVLTKRAGTEWLNDFSDNKFNIEESVILTVPALLSSEMIAAIKNRGASNKTYHHGHIKHQYLLARVVFCSECGHAMFGQVNHNMKRYYRHPRGRKNECDPSIWVPAQQLEEAVIVNLFAMFGDIERLEKAVKKATPDENHAEDMKVRLVAMEKNLAEIKRQKENVVSAIAEGIIDSDDARSRMLRLKEREGLLAAEKTCINAELESLPDFRKRLSALATAVKTKSLRLAYYPDTLGMMGYEAKRKVVQAAFAGKDRTGNRLGVYVSKADGVFHYDIRGIIPLENFEFTTREPILQGTLPMAKNEAQDIMGVDTDYSDFNPLSSDDTGKTKFALS